MLCDNVRIFYLIHIGTDPSQHSSNKQGTIINLIMVLL